MSEETIMGLLNYKKSVIIKYQYIIFLLSFLLSSMRTNYILERQLDLYSSMTDLKLGVMMRDDVTLRKF